MPYMIRAINPGGTRVFYRHRLRSTLKLADSLRAKGVLVVEIRDQFRELMDEAELVHELESGQEETDA